MPKKKKKNKKNNHAQQVAIRKSNARRQLVLFEQKLYEVAEAVGAGNILEQLSASEKNFLFSARFRPIRVESMPGMKWPSPMLGLVQTMVDNYMSSAKFSFPGSEQKFSLADYMTVILTLKHWLRTLEARKVPQREMYLEAFRVLLDFCNRPDNPEQQLRTYFDVIGNCMSQPDTICLYLKLTSVTKKSPRPYVAEVLQLHGCYPDKRTVRFKGANRSIFSLFYVNAGPKVLSLKAGLLNPGCPVPDMELKVYFQKHALDRLRERIDCVEFNLSYVEMCKSFEDPEVISEGELRGLVSFYLFDMKLGYFVVEVRDGIVTIRTFLFLTNDGTPEGDKLKKHLGLAQEDKQFTGLDRLSTFLHSDLRKDVGLCEVLHKTGCGVLLDTDLIEISKQENQQNGAVASRIRKYLMLEDEVRQVS